MDRMISLTVRTIGAEEWKAAFDLLCASHAELAETNEYVSFSSSRFDDSPSEPICEVPGHEDLVFDQGTITKIYEALDRVVSREFHLPEAFKNNVLVDMVTELQNSGVLFKERADRDRNQHSADPTS